MHLFRSFILFAACATVWIAPAPAAQQSPEIPKPTSHTAIVVRGWAVRIDDRLSQPANEAIRARGLDLLDAKLSAIAAILPPDRAALLRAIPIALDATHGRLRTMQYHPSADWLEKNGYARDLAGCVHIPDISDFLHPRHDSEQPWCVLHELAHAFHDTCYGFDAPRIREAFDRWKATGRGDSVLHISGGRQRHYALTDPMEFFAEMSEAFFGMNDFFPFNRAELATAEPEIHALLREIWGPLPAAGEPEPAAVSTRFGARCLAIRVGPAEGFLIPPARPAPDGSKPWVWYAPTLTGAHPDPSHDWLFTRLLDAGFAIAGVDVGESYGNRRGRAFYTAFHRLLVERYGLSPKACLLPQSRGGLMLYNWAAEHPEGVERIGGIYTVCDPASWPGLAKCCGAYGMSEEEMRRHPEETSPIDRLAPLAKARIPILHIHGDADTVVPLERNGAELARRYRALGGTMDLVVVPGKGHQVCPEFFEAQALLAFLLGGRPAPSGAAPAAVPAEGSGSLAPAGSARRFAVSIDPEMRRRFGFRYPATYVFRVEGAAPEWDARRAGGAALPKKTSSDFFNGIECARLDAGAGRLYVSAGFDGSPAMTLELGGFSSAAFEGVARYYDARKAAYTLSNDNWGCNPWGNPGAPWRGPTDDSSDKYQTALHVCRSFNLPLSIAINSRSAGGDEVWARMQEELDRGDASWEPAVHGWTHPKDAAAYLVHGYRAEILGCRDDILRRLRNIPYGQHVYEHILTHGYEDDDIGRTDAGEFLFLRGFNWLDNPGSVDYAPWDGKRGFYGIGGLNTKGYDVLLERREPKGRFCAADVAEANGAFDEVLRSGGIFYALWHPDRFQNSVVYDPRPGVEGKEGSTLMAHLAHVANRKDVWYVANGWLHSYRYVAERAKVVPAR
jgi:hypothetical protein